jgi:hypothetical protein
MRGALTASVLAVSDSQTWVRDKVVLQYLKVTSTRMRYSDEVHGIQLEGW